MKKKHTFTSNKHNTCTKLTEEYFVFTKDLFVHTMEHFKISFDLPGNSQPVTYQFEDAKMKNVPNGTVYMEVAANGEHNVFVNLQFGKQKYGINLSALPKLSQEHHVLRQKRLKEQAIKREKLQQKMRKAENTIRKAVQKHIALQPDPSRLTGSKSDGVMGKVESTGLTAGERKHACAVCLMYTGKSGTVRCIKCGETSHQACSGVSGKDVLSGSWECQPCSAGMKPADLVCALCGKKNVNGQLFKRSTEDNGWVHASCALFLHETVFLDHSTVDIVGSRNRDGKMGKLAKYIEANRFCRIKSDGENGNEKGVKQQPFACEVCKSPSGILTNCAVVGCEAKFHSICLKSNTNIIFPLFKNGVSSVNALCKYHTQLAYDKTAEHDTVVSTSGVRSLSHGGSARAKFLSSHHRKKTSSPRRHNIVPSKVIIASSGIGSANYLASKRVFYKALSQFHDVEGNADVMSKLPILAGEELDLYNFFVLVVSCGGCDRVVANEGTWSTIFKALPNYSTTETSSSYRLKKIYMKFLYDFEKRYKLGEVPEVLRGVNVDKEVEESRKLAEEAEETEESEESDSESESDESGEDSESSSNGSGDDEEGDEEVEAVIARGGIEKRKVGPGRSPKGRRVRQRFAGSR